jgi:hypothetical protein
MQPTDKAAFGVLVIGYFQEIYERSVTPVLLSVWWAALQKYPLADIEAAFARYVADPECCRFPPKPGDIVRYLDGDEADDGRPSADEAWGLLLRLIRDERETGVLSDEMREGWSACGPILDAGDEVGARRCFIAAYESHVRDARQRREPARWTPTLGTCPQLRAQRLGEAVNAGRLGREHVAGLLPGPDPASIDQVAGLLEGPDAPGGAFDAAESLRGLAAMLRRSMAYDEAERAKRRDAVKAAEDEARRRAMEIAERAEAELQAQLGDKAA